MSAKKLKKATRAHQRLEQAKVKTVRPALDK